MVSSKQTNKAKGKASPKSKNAASKVSEKSISVGSKTAKKTSASKTQTPAGESAAMKVTKKTSDSKKETSTAELAAEKANKKSSASKKDTSAVEPVTEKATKKSSASKKESSANVSAAAKTTKKTSASKKETPEVEPAAEKASKKTFAPSDNDIPSDKSAAEKTTNKVQKNEKPAPTLVKSASEKDKAETAKSFQTSLKAQTVKETKASQKPSSENVDKKPSEAVNPPKPTSAAAKSEVHSGKKRKFAIIKNDATVDSSDEENEEKSDFESEDEKQIMNKLDIDPKAIKPENPTAFTGIKYDTETNDLSVSIQEKLANRSHNSDEPFGIIYVGRLPTGFEEYELGVFFGQFGEIQKLRLSRNRRTGNSSHYAFIQYTSSEVAEIVAKAVNNYLVFGRLLKCEVVPKEKYHNKMFWGARPYVIPFVQNERKLRTATKSPKQIEANLRRNRYKKNKLAHKLKELGIDYDISEFSHKSKSEKSKSTTS